MLLKDLKKLCEWYPDDAELLPVFIDGNSAINIDLRITARDGTILNKSIGLGFESEYEDEGI